MRTDKWAEEELKEARSRVGFRLEEVALDFTEQIYEQMEKLDISKADLARHLNKSRAYITKVLSGSYNTNLTLKTMISFAMALESDLKVQLSPEANNIFVEHEWSDQFAKHFSLCWDEIDRNDFIHGIVERIPQEEEREEFADDREIEEIFQVAS
jgi:ribosome-binding protein aMBF1 (putative translation factor)